jgi:hypothetical protein
MHAVFHVAFGMIDDLVLPPCIKLRVGTMRIGVDFGAPGDLLRDVVRASSPVTAGIWRATTFETGFPPLDIQRRLLRPAVGVVPLFIGLPGVSLRSTPATYM